MSGTTEAHGELKGTLVRMGFTSHPPVVLVDPRPLSVASILPPVEQILLHGKPFRITSRTVNSRGLRGARDHLLQGTYDGVPHRVYLAARPDGTFLDAYIQPVVKSAMKGRIFLA